MKRYGLCRRCWAVPLVSGDYAWIVQEHGVVLRLDGTVKRRYVDKVLWCDQCGQQP